MKNLILFSIILISSCQKPAEKKSRMICPEDNPCINSENAIIMDYTGLDGCGFVIKLEKNGQILEPTNINDFPALKINNQKIKLTYSEQEGMASICMVGKIVKINCAELIQE